MTPNDIGAHTLKQSDRKSVAYEIFYAWSWVITLVLLILLSLLYIQKCEALSDARNLIVAYEDYAHSVHVENILAADSPRCVPHNSLVLP